MTLAAKRIVGGRDKGSLRRPDFHPTPPVATEALLAVEDFRPTVWEPACGDGAISRVLEDRGHDVLSTDLNDWGYGQSRIDFLMCAGSYLQHETPFDIVTNPPYKLALEFARHAIDLTAPTRGKVAFLMRLQWLEGQERKPFFEASPLARVWVFSWRVPRMHRHGYGGPKSEGGMIAFAWFVWDHTHAGPPVIGWL